MFGKKSRIYIGSSPKYLETLLGPFGKLAAIWFDEMIVPYYGLDFENLTEKMFKHVKMEKVARKELRKVWIPVRHRVNYKFFENPWKNKNRKLTKAAYDAVKESTDKLYQNTNHRMGYRREIAWAGAMAIDSLAAWALMNFKYPCSIFPTENERQVIEKVFRRKKGGQSFSAFQKVAQLRVPNLKDLKWEKVIELRHSSFKEGFRKQISKFQDKLHQGDMDEAKRTLNDLEQNELRKFLELHRPNVREAVIKGIGSNIPMAIPNPISTVLSLRDIYLNVRDKGKFGWLYFLMDFTNASRKP